VYLSVSLIPPRRLLVPPRVDDFMEDRPPGSCLLVKRLALAGKEFQKMRGLLLRMIAHRPANVLQRDIFSPRKAVIP